MRDLVTDATMAYTDGTAEEKLVAKQTWLEVAKAFWKTQHADTVVERDKAKSKKK